MEWPWQSLRVKQASLSQLLHLPDPTEGQYEIEVETLTADIHNVRAHTDTHAHTMPHILMPSLKHA